MAAVNPSLSFDGQCEEAFKFYQSVFGTELSPMMRWKDIPGETPVAPEDKEKIMHVSLPISKETILMGCDSSGTSEQLTSNISLSINTDSKENADRIFNGLSQGGQIKMPMTETFWGAYFGLLTDKFGIQWTISSDQKDN